MEKYYSYYDEKTRDIIIVQLDPKMYRGKGYVPLDKETTENLIKEIEGKRNKLE
ncbi:MAG: hypothetical protein ABIG69_19320 [Bacteroidota bacterium]